MQATARDRRFDRASMEATAWERRIEKAPLRAAPRNPERPKSVGSAKTGRSQWQLKMALGLLLVGIAFPVFASVIRSVSTGAVMQA